MGPKKKKPKLKSQSESQVQVQSQVQPKSKSNKKSKSKSASKFNSKSNRKTKLPIFWYKSKILETIKTNSVTIITGPTGCGKSSQIPQYLYESGYGINGIIACLHPRCIAAVVLAERVSNEVKQVIGDLVGYEIRFFKEKSEKTRIMFMTTGLMLQRMKNNDFIIEYSVVIIDEAHERSVQTDVVMGKMKEILKSYQHVKLIIMSATLNVNQIKDFYGECAVINIANMEDNVQVIYRPLKTQNYVCEIKIIVEEILKSSSTGHILIFLQSEDKVYKCRKSLKNLKKTKLLPFYASLDQDEKMLVFQDYDYRRKIIIATNVAETSLTIPGVNFVIDSGFVKRVRYDHESGVEKWMTERVSIAEANQRKGRTGRTGEGICYRLYDEKCIKGIDDISELHNDLQSLTMQSNVSSSKKKEKKIDQFQEYPEPEIKTMNLSSIILTLKAMNENNVMEFPFIVPPNEKRVNKCIDELKHLSLLHDNGTLTRLGQDVSSLPLEPRLGKVAMIGSQLACRDDINIIIAMLSVRNVLTSRVKDQKVYHTYAGNKGDFFMLYNIFSEAMENYFTKDWCKTNFINHSCIKYTWRVYQQLSRILPPAYANGNYFRGGYNDNLVKKVFLSGFFNNVARRLDGGKYLTLAESKVSVHKQSSFDGKEEIVFYLNIQKPSDDSETIIRNCCSLNVQMIQGLSPQKFKIKAHLWKSVVEKLFKS